MRSTTNPTALEGRRLDWRRVRGRSIESALSRSDWVCFDVLLKVIAIGDKSQNPKASELNHLAYKRGDEMFKVANFYSAASEFTEALEYWPQDSEAWMALGNCFDEIEKPRKAEYCFKAALLHCREEKRPSLEYNLGNSLFDQGRMDEAITLYAGIPKEHSSYKKAQENLGLARQKSKN